MASTLRHARRETFSGSFFDLIAARKKYEQLFTPPAVLPVITEFYEMAISKGIRLEERTEP